MSEPVSEWEDFAELTVRHLTVPVEDVRPGDVYTLPDGREVEVEKVDHYDDQPEGEAFFVRYRHGTEPGSLKPMRRGEQLPIARPAAFRGARQGVMR